MLARDCRCTSCRAALALDAGRPVMLHTKADLDELLGSGALAGRAVYMDVLHDDGCPMEPCTCAPWYVLRSLTDLLVGAARGMAS